MDSPMWVLISASFSAVYTTAQNNFAFAIDTGGQIYDHNQYTNSWTPMSSPSVYSIVSLSAGADGSLAVVDSIGDSYVHSYGSWTNLYIPALSVSLGDSQNFAVSDFYGTITESSFGSQNYSPAGPTRLSATAGLANMWGVDGTGAVYQKAGGSWTSVSGKTLKQIDVSLSSSNTAQICGVDVAGDAWVRSGSTWLQMVKPMELSYDVQFVSVEAGQGKVWATFSNGAIYCGQFY